MCTRYYLSPSTPELKKIIEAVKTSPLSRRFIYRGNPIKTEGEIRPSDVVPVLAPNPRGEQTVYPMKWGYTNPHKKGSLLLNARSETAYQKPTFKYDWLNHRCIIPATYYYEWEHFKGNDGTTKVGERYMIQPKSEDVTWLCGLNASYPSLLTYWRMDKTELRSEKNNGRGSCGNVCRKGIITIVTQRRIFCVISYYLIDSSNLFLDHLSHPKKIFIKN